MNKQRLKRVFSKQLQVTEKCDVDTALIAHARSRCEDDVRVFRDRQRIEFSSKPDSKAWLAASQHPYGQKTLASRTRSTMAFPSAMPMCLVVNSNTTREVILHNKPLKYHSMMWEEMELSSVCCGFLCRGPEEARE
jgi:hypothetical protein